MSKETEYYYIASCSWGKDSIAMLLLMLDNPKYPLNCVVFTNTGFEFSSIYTMRDRMLPILKKRGIRYVELDISKKFSDLLWNKYAWCGGQMRWGTSRKLEAINHFYKTLPGDAKIVEYVGFAVDELERTFRSNAQKGTKVYPLIDFGYTEKMALDLCYASGFDFVEPNGLRLYDFMDRGSCWCCRNKNLHELNNMYNFFPNYWEGLKAIQNKYPEMAMKPAGSVDGLEKRFNERGLQLTFHI